MTQEEKKAIEDLKGMIQAGGTLDSGFEREEEKIFQTILNLIEKLQKERDIYYYEWKTLEADLINNDIIPKDKIRDFIKRLEKDVENIREKKKDSHDYDRSSSRIQAYLTKTNEIIKRLKELLEESE